VRTETTAERIAANVRAEMARKGVTQQKLAVHLDWSQAAISRRLSARVAFNVDELARIAAFLAVPLSALLGEAA
jgi:transcriptional regulator with XRE-family HTH domain